MQYREFTPSEPLQPYIKCYYIFETGSNAVFEDRAFATGCIELMFNLGGGEWQTFTNSGFTANPPVELWGQVIEPLSFRSIGANRMLGVRFYPHTASVFLNEDVQVFNNRVNDFNAIAGRPVKELHTRLLEATSMSEQIRLLEAFLMARCYAQPKHFEQLKLINHVMHELKQEDFFEKITSVASRYGITSRYLQKLFLKHTGLTPKLYTKINRFQNSLVLVSKREESLTSIAYECNYFDQAHFIREFKSFTGLTPSEFLSDNSSAILASPNK